MSAKTMDNGYLCAPLSLHLNKALTLGWHSRPWICFSLSPTCPCPSTPMTHLHPQASSSRLPVMPFHTEPPPSYSPTRHHIPLVPLCSVCHHRSLSCVFISSCLLSFPLRQETTWGQGASHLCPLLYLQHLEKYLVHKYLWNEWIC